MKNMNLCYLIVLRSIAVLITDYTGSFAIADWVNTLNSQSVR
jgi:hypothetical protein